MAELTKGKISQATNNINDGGVMPGSLEADLDSRDGGSVAKRKLVNSWRCQSSPGLSRFPGLSTFSGLSTWERHEFASATIIWGFLFNGT